MNKTLIAPEDDPLDVPDSKAALVTIDDQDGIMIDGRVVDL